MALRALSQNRIDSVTLVGTATGTNPQYMISFRYAFPSGSVGTHTIQVVGINSANNQTITDASVFSLSPHVFPTDSSGVALISIPYFSDAEDVASAQQAKLPPVFPPTLNLYRWLNVPTLVPGTSTTQIQGTYAIYGPTHTFIDPASTGISGFFKSDIFARSNNRCAFRWIAESHRISFLHSDPRAVDIRDVRVRITPSTVPLIPPASAGIRIEVIPIFSPLISTGWRSKSCLASELPCRLP